MIHQALVASHEVYQQTQPCKGVNKETIQKNLIVSPVFCVFELPNTKMPHYIDLGLEVIYSLFHLIQLNLRPLLVFDGRFIAVF